MCVSIKRISPRIKATQYLFHITSLSKWPPDTFLKTTGMAVLLKQPVSGLGLKGTYRFLHCKDDRPPISVFTPVTYYTRKVKALLSILL